MLDTKILDAIDPIMILSIANIATGIVASFPAICITNKIPNTPSKVPTSYDIAIELGICDLIFLDNTNPNIKKNDINPMHVIIILILTMYICSACCDKIPAKIIEIDKIPIDGISFFIFEIVV